MAARNKKSTSNRVAAGRSIFVAYPFRLYAKNNADYRAVYAAVEKALKVKFIFADDELTSRHILDKIRGYVQETVFGIYDISAWNPNVTLELGLAFGLQKQAFIAVDASKNGDRQDVPADIAGFDRIQYSSFAELTEKLLALVAGALPVPRESEPNPIEKLQAMALDLFTDSATGLAMSDIAKALGISTELARMVIAPLIGLRITTTGAKKGMKYYKKSLPRGRPAKPRAAAPVKGPRRKRAH